MIHPNKERVYAMSIRHLIYSVALSFVLLGAGVVIAQDSISAAIQPYVEQGVFPGLLSVSADQEGRLTVESVGWADIERRIPMAMDSVYWIASMTKGVTGAGLLILVDEGLVDLDAPIENYLPEFKNIRVEEAGENGVVTVRPPKTKPTLRQAMCHMAGFRFVTPTMDRFGIDIFPARILASTMVEVPLFADPGTKFGYSNLGIDVGAAVIEAVTGAPFEEFLQKRIFDPLEMNDTSFWLTEDQNARLVTPYKVVDGQCVADTIDPLTYPLTDRNRRYAEAGGGLFSTPRDIIKFYQMIAGKGEYRGVRILSEEAIRTLATKQTPEGTDAAYSVGMWTDGESIWHGGALGTEGHANLQTGEARIYMVQLTSSVDPKIKETVNRILDSRVK
jgi:CubicO group peptidase (beta-lactamase class C family)